MEVRAQCACLLARLLGLMSAATFSKPFYGNLPGFADMLSVGCSRDGSYMQLILGGVLEVSKWCDFLVPAALTE